MSDTTVASPDVVMWSWPDLLKYIKQKAGNIVDSDVFYDYFGTEQRNYAFTVSRLAEMRQIEAVYEMLVAVETSGGSLGDFMAGLRDWSGLTPAHIGTIFHTNMAFNYSAGADQWQRSSIDIMPYWWLWNPGDDHTEEICLPIAESDPQIILPANLAWWSWNTPPFHYRCRTVKIALTEEEADAQGIYDYESYGLPEINYQDGFGMTPTIGGAMPYVNQQINSLQAEVR